MADLLALIDQSTMILQQETSRRFRVNRGPGIRSLIRCWRYVGPGLGTRTDWAHICPVWKFTGVHCPLRATLPAGKRIVKVTQSYDGNSTVPSVRVSERGQA